MTRMFQLPMRIFGGLSRSGRISTMLGIALLVVLCIAGRLLPHPPNFTPVAAAALFAGSVFRRRWAAVCVPILGLALSDWIIGTYEFRTMLVVYTACVLPIYLAVFLRGRYPALRLAACSVLSSMLFFVSTNFAVWAFSGYYSPTPDGLVSCFLSALPFYKYTLLGDLSWSAGLFACYALAMRTGVSSISDPHSVSAKPVMLAVE